MPEYNRLKGSTPSLEFFVNSELAAEATLDAQRILAVDAAIVFADLLPILVPLGFDLDYLPGKGPHIRNPFTGPTTEFPDLAEAVEHLDYIGETIRNILSGLAPNIPLIGFAGAPFTLAAYAIEGEASREFVNTKCLMYRQPKVWHEFLDTLAKLIAAYVDIQIAAGVHVIQIFDSWVGCLSVADYRQYVAPHTTDLMKTISGRVPIIYFGTGNGHLLHEMYSTGPDVMALDWRSTLSNTWEELGCQSIQGNLDPALLLAEPDVFCQAASDLLSSVKRKPGHIFNLGHGILPETRVDHVQRLIAHVHETSLKSRD